MRDYRLYIQDMLEAITNIESYMDDLTYEEFTKDMKTADAVIRNILIIGEAAKNVPESLKREHSEIEWKRISGMRDKLVHEYHGVSLKVVWDTTKIDLPLTKSQLQKF